MASAISPERTRSVATFVGRDRELAELRAGLDDVGAGHGRLFLLSGEPGIGKTRLSEEISNDASARGMRVVWGRSWEGGGAPAYWPLVQVIRALVEGVNPGDLNVYLGSDARDIARMVPELFPPAAVESSAAGPDPGQGRFRLFDTVASLVRNSARLRPLLMIVDDLHDADEPSVQMLTFVARTLKAEPLMIIGTYRDLEVRRSPGLLHLIGELRREGVELSLGGLDEKSVASLIQQRLGLPPKERMAAELHSATAGNPLFVDGVTRMLAAEGKLGDHAQADTYDFKLPASVRETIRSRIEALPDSTRSILSTATVFGTEFELRPLAQVAELSAGEALESLEEALRTGIVMAISRQRYRFAHALIRRELYDSLGQAARLRMHRRIGETLEGLYQANPGSHLAELAHHFREDGVAEKAIDYLSRAGDEAWRVYAHEDALSHWSAALELVEEFGGYRRLYADLHHKHAHAMGVQGERAGRREHLEEALRMYEELGDAHGAAEVHVSLGNDLSVVGFAGAQDIPRAADHLRQAEAVLSKGPDNYNLVLLYLFIGNVAARSCRVRDAVVAFRHSMEIAERIGDSGSWTVCAGGLTTTLTQTGQIGEALEIQAQVWSKLDTLNIPGAAFAAVGWAGSCLMELWDPRGAQRWWATELAKSRLGKGQRKVLMRGLQVADLWAGDLPAARSLLAQGPHPGAAGMLAFYEGEWERADSIFEQCLERARSGVPGEMQLYGQALARVRWVRREPAHAETLLRDALALYSEEEPHCQVEMVVRPELALVYLEMGKLEDAVAEVSRCREVSAGEDWRGLGGHLARADAAVADRAGKLDAALEGFETAVTIFRKYALPWEEADTLQRWGRAMFAAGAPDRAIEKFDAAIEIYRRCGAGERWVERVEADRPSSAPRTAKGEDTAGVQNDAVFRGEGDYWTIAYEGKTARLKDAKGLHYIAYLLAHPGQEIRALDLVTRIGGGGEEPLETASAKDFARSDTVAGNLGHAGEVLDAQAKAAYGRRLKELREELEEARELGNEQRAEKAEEEIEALGRMLKGAIGLAGRDRRAASSTERARIAVTKAIRLSLNKIAENDASLGKLLSTTIKTGTVCAYVPDDRFPVSWRL
jgi:tetratricopeptide (TPR) repeat protein